MILCTEWSLWYVGWISTAEMEHIRPIPGMAFRCFLTFFAVGTSCNSMDWARSKDLTGLVKGFGGIDVWSVTLYSSPSIYRFMCEINFLSFLSFSSRLLPICTFFLYYPLKLTSTFFISKGWLFLRTTTDEKESNYLADIFLFDPR